MRCDGVTSDPSQLQAVRSWLGTHVVQACAAYRALHSGDRCAQAAAQSTEAILLADDDTATAASLRKAAIERHGCYVAVDSLRKRESPVLEMIARSAFADTRGEGDELFVNIGSMLRVLRPFAELAALNVADAAKLFSQRAALHDDAVLGRAIEHAVWAVAKFGALPVYGLDRLRALGVSDFAGQTVEYLLDGIIKVPFVTQPDDVYQLATAIQVDESAETFYARLLNTPVMLPVVERFVVWLSRHDPKTCLYDSNDVMVGYCSPHYYVALCESVADVQADWASGRFHADARDLLAGLNIANRSRHPK